jgi:hypothetical protein
MRVKVKLVEKGAASSEGFIEPATSFQSGE